VARCRSLTPRLAAVLVPVLVAGAALTGCSTPEHGDGRPTVAAAFYPIGELVQQLGGTDVHELTVVPPGQEAHEYEPTPQQLASLERADVVFYLGRGFQPVVEQLVRQLPGRVRKVDLLDGLELRRMGTRLPGTDGAAPGETLTGGDDPHVWLDPTNMRVMAAEVASHLLDLGIAAATLDQRLTAYDASLTALDGEFHAGLAHCASPYLVTGHQAFGYLAAAYGLIQVAIAGISPEEEPSASTLEAVARFARSHHVTTIFFEQNLSTALARTVADEVGASTAVLGTLETLSDDQLRAGATYVSVMRENLATLRHGLDCT
jgi:zinc transport system substrate-binding protein